MAKITPRILKESQALQCTDYARERILTFLLLAPIHAKQLLLSQNPTFLNLKCIYPQHSLFSKGTSILKTIK